MNIDTEKLTRVIEELIKEVKNPGVCSTSVCIGEVDGLKIVLDITKDEDGEYNVVDHFNIMNQNNRNELRQMLDEANAIIRDLREESEKFRKHFQYWKDPTTGKIEPAMCAICGKGQIWVVLNANLVAEASGCDACGAVSSLLGYHNDQE